VVEHGHARLDVRLPAVELHPDTGSPCSRAHVRRGYSSVEPRSVPRAARI
jgi:hypothetical protein